MYERCTIGDMKQRTNIRLDEQAREDARLVAKQFNLGSTSAAVRFALRDLARRIEQGEKVEPLVGLEPTT